MIAAEIAAVLDASKADERVVLAFADALYRMPNGLAVLARARFIRAAAGESWEWPYRVAD